MESKISIRKRIKKYDKLDINDEMINNLETFYFSYKQLASCQQGLSTNNFCYAKRTLSVQGGGVQVYPFSGCLKTVMQIFSIFFHFFIVREVTFPRNSLLNQIYSWKITLGKQENKKYSWKTLGIFSMALKLF